MGCPIRYLLVVELECGGSYVNWAALVGIYQWWSQNGEGLMPVSTRSHVNWLGISLSARDCKENTQKIKGGSSQKSHPVDKNYM